MRYFCSKNRSALDPGDFASRPQLPAAPQPLPPIEKSWLRYCIILHASAGVSAFKVGGPNLKVRGPKFFYWF